MKGALLRRGLQRAFHERPHFRLIAVGLPGVLPLVLELRRPDAGTEQVRGKDAVAHLHKHPRTDHLVVGQAIPVVNKKYQATAVLGRFVITFVAAAIDRVANRLCSVSTCSRSE